MTRQQLLVRLAPLLVVALARSTQGLVLPGIIEQFHLSMGQGGFIVTVLQLTSFFSMLALGFVMDDLGPARIVRYGLPVVMTGLALASAAPSFAVVSLFFATQGMGNALVTGAVNTVMADTGARRATYLGIMHSIFSLLAVVAPIVAGAIIAVASWRTYYQFVALVALFVTVLTRISLTAPQAQKAARNSAKGLIKETLGSIGRIWTICVGMFTLVGVQGTFVAWSYLYVVDVYRVSHTMGTVATSVLWAGILVGRTSSIWLSRSYPPRTILVAACMVPVPVIVWERLAPSFPLAAAVLFLIGIGVSGAYQLGTAWGAERVPERIGTASTAVMSFASLGVALWPWVTGMIVDRFDFRALPFLAMAMLLISAGVFLSTPASTRHAVRPAESV